VERRGFLAAAGLTGLAGPAAYAFARLEFRGRRVLFAAFLRVVIPMAVPAVARTPTVRSGTCCRPRRPSPPSR
jgi:ABC-type glycerol-3-phosphate transport system permease component